MLTYQLHQVFVGRCKYPDIHWKDPVSAQSHDLTLLQNTQQPALKGHWHFPYLIEENGPIVSQLKEPHLSAAPGAGKGTVIISKKLTLQNSLGKSRTVYSNKRTVSAAAGIVHALGKHLLTGTRLTQQKYSQVRMGVPLCMLDALIHLLAASAYILKRIGGLKSLDAFIPDFMFPSGDGSRIIEGDNRTQYLSIFIC